MIWLLIHLAVWVLAWLGLYVPPPMKPHPWEHMADMEQMGGGE